VSYATALARAHVPLDRGGYAPTMLERLKTSFSDRRLAALGALGLLSVFTLVTIGVRVAYTGTSVHAGIAWNLVLAWIPLALALLVYDRARAGAAHSKLLALGALWLLFFPNAPYIVTDLKHIHGGASVPVWYDVVLLSSAAWTGLVLGFLSLYLIQAVVRRSLGPTVAWAFVAVTLALTSFGIYIGRFLRLNSWDVFVQPQAFAGVFRAIADPLAHPRTVAVTILFTAFLGATYLVFYAFAYASALVRD
jgi:uncharacterized membrane protein